MGSTVKLLALVYLSTVTAIPQSNYSINEEDYHENDIITRDVVVIGGGSGGTYAATRLSQLGQSVVLVEKNSLLGGMTNTYTVPNSGVKVDYGVIFFHNNPIVQNYFDYYNIPLSPLSFTPSGTTYNVDFSTGKVVPNYPGNQTESFLALGAYVAQLEKYPYLTTGYDLPDPVPEDLLIPFKDFAAKYNLGPMVSYAQVGGGYADLLEQATLYTIKLLGPDLIQSLLTGLLSTAAHDNSAIYEAATSKFSSESSLLLSSTVVFVVRNCDSKGSAAVVVKTPSGLKLIKATKIVVAYPPQLSNFLGWDLDYTETEVFGTYTYEGYWTALLTGTGLPENTTFNNVGANTLYNWPVFPGCTVFTSTAQPGLFNIEYTAPHVFDEDYVKKEMLAALETLDIPGVTPTPQKAEWKVFTSHTPFFGHVTAEQIKAGFYKKAMGLQGHQNTWYTGAAWQAHDSSMIWNFTETILPSILKA